MAKIIKFPERKSSLFSPKLQISHKEGKITGTDSFGERLIRIRASLEKINKLMAELKGITDESRNDYSSKERN